MSATRRVRSRGASGWRSSTTGGAWTSSPKAAARSEDRRNRRRRTVTKRSLPLPPVVSAFTLVSSMIHSEVKIVDLRAFRCDVLLTPGDRFEPGYLRVADGSVVSAGAGEAADEAVPLRGTVVPGLVDLEVNGLGPHDA